MQAFLDNFLIFFEYIINSLNLFINFFTNTILGQIFLFIIIITLFIGILYAIFNL